jgi:hypothetical protein
MTDDTECAALPDFFFLTHGVWKRSANVWKAEEAEEAG